MTEREARNRRAYDDWFAVVGRREIEPWKPIGLRWYLKLLARGKPRGRPRTRVEVKKRNPTAGAAGRAKALENRRKRVRENTAVDFGIECAGVLQESGTRG